jgi:phage terminase small subunit
MPDYVPVRARKHRYRQFAAKYIKNGCNGLQTAIDCGFTDNPDSAKVIASRLLTYIYVDEQIKKIQSAADVTAERVTKEIAEVAFSDVKISEAGKMKALESLTSILGMKKGEIPQKPEQSAMIEESILRQSERTKEDPDDIAISLITSFTGQPEFLDPALWGRFSHHLLSKIEKVDGIQ